jgi:hypothetical protein
MYFVEKVKLKQLAFDPKLTYPIHKLIGHFYTLEDAIKSVKECAKDYMTKKNLKYTDQTQPDIASHVSLETNKRPKKITRYTMRSNTANKNVIDVYKEEEIYREGYITSSIKRTEQKIAYFVYTTYANCESLGCSENILSSIPPPPPNPINVTNVTNRVKGRLNNMGKELEMIEGHARLVEEFRQSSRYKRNNSNEEEEEGVVTATEIIDNELKHLEELRKHAF